MTPAELLTDAFDRILKTATAAVDGLSEEQLAARPAADANSVAWLVWHLARVQDDHVADAAGTEQVWTAQDFVSRLDLPFDSSATGFGMSSEDVGHVRASAQLLADYVKAVHDATVAYVAKLTPDDLDRIVDERWDPPVSLGVRLVSVVNDDMQHAGQASYVRGLVTSG
ncbi:MAG TPA: DUF664 domain-containing protein [Nocardioides sp.]|uniref:mycothiol transferase n=1 Tax=Nocardioides sp. TaxID=35761 RepID=UPI002E314AE9|nr:DUF664 domain-containing protein [Nocardioides sp.]HEX5087449.1 DUF664 domain-containing protein [Nocardioides sp.]